MRAQSEPHESESSQEDLEGDHQIFGRQLWRLLPFLRPYAFPHITTGILANAFARAFDLLPFVAIGLYVDYALDGVVRGPDWFQDLVWNGNEHLFYGTLIFLAFSGLAIFQGISDLSWQILSQRTQHDLRLAAFSNLVKMEQRYFEDRQVGDVMSVLSADVNQLEEFVSDSSTSIIRLVVTFSTAFVILMTMSWKLTLVLFGPLFFIIPMVYFFSTRVQGKYRKSRQSFGDINSVLENTISGMGVVQAYSAEEKEAIRVGKESQSYMTHAISASWDRAKFIPMIYVIAGLAFGFLISLGGLLLRDGTITVGNFTTFLLISTRMTMPMFILGLLVNQIQRSEASARRVFAVMDLEPSIIDNEDSLSLDKRVTSLKFEGVTFAYPGGPNVLNGVSFGISQDEMIGIVGPSGAGKSTIVKLLLRYYEPNNGTITMNDSNLQELTLESMRSQLGYVSQDVFLFHGTIRDNIAYAVPNASDEQIKDAAQVAGAWSFIANLEDGINTVVGERGVKLSGGQRQRISLARALLRDPALLILDEATSSLDSATEEVIQRNLSETRSGRMTIAVAHRLSTIRKANFILVLVDGVVMEMGTHEELVSANGVYADLWNVQSGSLKVHSEEE